MGELLVSGRVMNQVFNSIDVQLFFVETRCWFQAENHWWCTGTYGTSPFPALVISLPYLGYLGDQNLPSPPLKLPKSSKLPVFDDVRTSNNSQQHWEKWRFYHFDTYDFLLASCCNKTILLSFKKDDGPYLVCFQSVTSNALVGLNHKLYIWGSRLQKKTTFHKVGMRKTSPTKLATHLKSWGFCQSYTNHFPTPVLQVTSVTNPKSGRNKFFQSKSTKKMVVFFYQYRKLFVYQGHLVNCLKALEGAWGWGFYFTMLSAFPQTKSVADWVGPLENQCGTEIPRVLPWFRKKPLLAGKAYQKICRLRTVQTRSICSSFKWAFFDFLSIHLFMSSSDVVFCC